MTAAVIGIALALPAGFLGLLDNVEAVTAQWRSGWQASLFLERDLPPASQRKLADAIRERDEVDAVTRLSREEALAEFQRHSDFDRALELLETNPLPPVLIVEPRSGLDPGATGELTADFDNRPEVERVRLDRQWVQRLHALLNLAERGIWLITALLGITVILVVGNTIRLDIESRRDEIVISKLIGGTDAFVRRPFLYAGLGYGIAGGMLATILVEGGRWILARPVNQLASLYDSSFRLDGIGLAGVGTLFAAGALLGLLGSWLAVTRHLAAIEPA
jgi:cell division transport system permease protein